LRVTSFLLVHEDPADYLIAIENEFSGPAQAEVRQAHVDVALPDSPGGTTEKAGDLVDVERIAQ